jgi:ADP-L-glycero-D-manno-heptose 6-epimerase
MHFTVTGGMGFIGSAIIKELNRRNYHNITVVDFPEGRDKWRNLVGLVFREVIDPDNLIKRKGMRDDGVVIHLGADSSTDISFKQAYRDYRYTLELFNGYNRLVYASSAGTYGTDGLCFSDGVVNDLRPKSAYALGKHMTDLYLQGEHGVGGVVGLKYSNVFGPGEYHKGRMASMMFHWYNKIRDGEELPLFQPEDELARDFIYVKDVARMTVDLALGDANGIFNIGSGRATTFKRVLELMCDMLGVEEMVINKIKMPRELEFQYQRRTELDMTKTSRHIDASTMSIEDAIEDYLRYLNKGLRIGEI